MHPWFTEHEVRERQGRVRAGVHAPPRGSRREWVGAGLVRLGTWLGGPGVLGPAATAPCQAR
jgi:hypothetical protein